ncbi:hypothetical protein R6Q59_030245 [Mikania micrantha]|uniref:SGNH hydrolase-type esterase domain-containing protein n=1 Tax=Mikania micrantha TaxID=192012 RepID=A0A5N6LRL1_9ASTR|nr:hypothetical protein E3N88_37614 [Mikania micrantha]
MMERLPQLILILGVFLTALASVDANVKSVFVFGDDQFDPGNNRFIKNCTFQANFRPYGSSFFYYPTGRFTNGRTIADFIAQFLGIKFQRPYQDVHRQLPKDRRKGFPQNGLNFASGGSGLLQGTNKDKVVTSIQAQLQQFHSLISHKRLHKNQIEKSLFLLGSGGNDIFSYFLLHGTSKITIPRTYVHAMLKEVARFTSQIYKYGGRRFVFFSIGPIGCIPGRVLIRGASTNHCNDQMNSMVEYYNAGLKSLVYKIPVMYPGAIGVFGSMHDTTMKYHNNPESYGFADVTHACCGDGPLNGMLQCGLKGYKMCVNPDGHFFWDYFHPSEHTYGLVSKDFWAGGNEDIWPMNLKTLAYNITSP